MTVSEAALLLCRPLQNRFSLQAKDGFFLSPNRQEKTPSSTGGGEESLIADRGNLLPMPANVLGRNRKFVEEKKL